MSIDALKAKGEFKHCYHHDLESLVYVLIFVATLYSGPYNKLRVWATSDSKTGDDSDSPEVEEDRESLGRKKYYKNIDVAKWNGDTGLNEQDIAKIKAFSMNTEPEFINEIQANFDPYFEPLYDCILELRRLLRPPVRREKEHNQTRLFIKMLMEKEVIDWDVIWTQEQSFPLGERNKVGVFKSFVKILDEAYESLPEEHKKPAARPVREFEDVIPIRRQVDLKAIEKGEKKGNDGGLEQGAAKSKMGAGRDMGPPPVPSHASGSKRTRDQTEVLSGTSSSKRQRRLSTAIAERRSGSRQSKRILQKSQTTSDRSRGKDK